MRDKRSRLARLRARIVREVYFASLSITNPHEVWFFPPYKGVEGWLGTQRIMFVGLNPSTGRFPSDADERFYEQLKAAGFARAHLTDVIKERAVAGSVGKIMSDDGRMRRYQRYLRKEIDIIQPRLIVGVGRLAHEKLNDWFGSAKRVKGILKRLPHYAPRYVNDEKRRHFRSKMAELRREYERASRLRLKLKV